VHASCKCTVHLQVQVIMGSKDLDFKSPSAEAAYVAKVLRGEVRTVN
jgi:hypothetical protein